MDSWSETERGRLAEELETWCSVGVALSDRLSGTTLSIDDVALLATLALRQPLSASGLAEALSASKSNITRSLRRLDAMGLLFERVDSRDRRRSLFRITTRGENVLFELKQYLGREELETWAGGMARLNAAAKAAGKNCGTSLGLRQAAALLALQARGHLTVGELSWLIASRQSTTSMLVRQLKSLDVVKEQACPGDRRVKNLMLTHRGQAASQEALKCWNAAK